MVSAASSKIDVPGLTVELRHEFRIGSLRYFAAPGSLDAAVRDLAGGPLPAPLKASRYSIAPSGGEIILAWRSPTETLILTPSEDAFGAVAVRTAGHSEAGYLVEQTGGLRVWHASGDRTGDLLARMGSFASIPALGEARVSRVAELPLLTLCVREGQIMLVVERVYSDHLSGWIDQTAADLNRE